MADGCLDIVNDYLLRCEKLREFTLANGTKARIPAPHAVCRDGFRISIQAGEFSYCEPRVHTGPWTKVECGYPSDTEEDLLPWAEALDEPLNTVYAWVPVDVVASVLEKHGGIDYESIALRILENSQSNQ